MYGCGYWVWLTGGGFGLQEVDMSGKYGCGCKEEQVYRFPHKILLLIPTIYSCISSFLQQHPYFLFIFKYIYIVLQSFWFQVGLVNALHINVRPAT